MSRTAALSLALVSVGAAQSPPSKRMPDGSDDNCRRYGRLYTWTSAQAACRALGNGWRLPTNEDWRQLANQYGGLRQESADLGKAAYTALLTGGTSGFDAVLVTDLPPEEAEDVQPVFRTAGLETVFLVSPTSSPARMAHAARLSSGFLYVVSRTGTTGARGAFARSLPATIAR